MSVCPNLLKVCRPSTVAGVKGVVCALVLLAAGTGARAEDRSTDWLQKPRTDSQLRLLNTQSQREGERRFQRFRFQCAADFQRCAIEAELPALVPVEEFRAFVLLNSTHAGLRLGVRLVFPGQINPKTGQVLRTWVRGEPSMMAADWVRLEVAVTPSRIEEQLRRVRQELAPVSVDSEGMYIDRCALFAEFSQGECVVDLQSLHYGPVVERSMGTGASGTIAGLAVHSEVHDPQRLEIQRSQMYLEGKPLFLLLAPDHGETLSELRQLGVNSVWLGDYRPTDRAQELSDEGFVIAATPPQPEFDPTDFSSPTTGLAPLEQASPTTDLWMLGTRVPPSGLPWLMAWAREVQSADRVRRRQIMADVIGDEGLASRMIDGVGVGLPAVHRSLTMGQARNRIARVTRRASQLTLPWTWIQTESPDSMTRWRSRLGLPPLVVEPEQVTMQVVAALSGGTRAVAFWKTGPFRNEDGDVSEVGLAVGLASLQIRLLEPWLVQGQSVSYLNVDDRGARQQQRDRQGQSLLEATLRSSRLSMNPLESAIPRKPDAAVISGKMGQLILVASWDTSSQFVPGPLFVREARLVANAMETASASQITTTGVIGHPRVETAGGLDVTIRELDQYAVLLLSSDPGSFRQMSRRIQQIAPRAAELQCRIARQKLQRVVRTCGRIDAVAPQVPPSAARLLNSAESLLESAESSLASERYAVAEGSAKRCLRVLRQVQNLYSREAVFHPPTLPSPTASPFTIAFSSLPEHWQMMNAVHAEAPSENLLPGGRVNRRDLLEQLGWGFPELPDNVYSTLSDVRHDVHNDTRVLRLAARKPRNKRAPLSTQPSTLINSPAVPVEAGDIIEIQGRVRMGRQITASEEHPLMIFGSELGPEFAVRPALERTWQTFHVYRLAADSGLFRASFALQGSAEVHLDLDSLMVRRVGRLQLGSGDLPRGRLQSADGSREQGAGHSRPSLD